MGKNEDTFCEAKLISSRTVLALKEREKANARKTEEEEEEREGGRKGRREGGERGNE